ncbi:hypothetical protein [Streptomyces paludis]|nr:hypothetical protein [Streptomyces paludis]
MDELEQAAQWRAEDDEPPGVWLWRAGKGPALHVRIDGRWLPSSVLARLAYGDGRVAYQVVVTPPPSGGYERTYRWPQKGKLRPTSRTDTPAARVIGPA